MMPTRLTITKIECHGPGQSAASVDLAPGLNVIVGASNTGKTYVFRLIDYLFGASDPPPAIPEARGYNRAYMGLRPSDRGELTISRALGGGDAIVYEAAPDAITATTAYKQLGGRHITGDTGTLSYFLLSLIGLAGLEVRRNERGEKSALTFRDVAWLTLVDEGRIIDSRSPALSGQYVETTKEKAALGYFLIGTDDAAIVSQEKPKDRRSRLATEAATIKSILDAHEEHLRQLATNPSELDNQLARTDAAIAEAAQLIATAEAEIAAAEQLRGAAWRRAQEVRSRRLFLAEQAKRLNLLENYYGSDLERLDAMMEAGKAFEELPDGSCPVCGNRLEEGAKPTAEVLGTFQAACESEVGKIRSLTQDLSLTVQGMQAEDSQLRAELSDLNHAVRTTESQIQELLRPRSVNADRSVATLINARDAILKAIAVRDEAQNLRARLERVEQAMKSRLPKQKLPQRVETRTAVKFCEIVRRILNEWKYPSLSTVTFDSEKFDLVIGERNRGDMGKGYRALTNAAFTIGLMRYCRSVGIPHSGIVILDTPLNPFRGPDEGPENNVNEEIKEAFYTSLANDKSGDQIIVMENSEPPSSVRKHITYHHFSANIGAGRYGFFPLAKPG